MLTAEFIENFQAQMPRSFRVDRDDNGFYRVATSFWYDDGDEPVIALVEDRANERILLSDLGDVFFRTINPGRVDQNELNRILDLTGVSRWQGALTRPLPPDRCYRATEDFAFALLRIDRVAGGCMPTAACP